MDLENKLESIIESNNIISFYKEKLNEENKNLDSLKKLKENELEYLSKKEITKIDKGYKFIYYNTSNDPYLVYVSDVSKSIILVEKIEVL